MSKLPLQIAIVGCGGMGSGHARAIAGIKERPGFLSYTAADIDPRLPGKLVLRGIYDIAEGPMEWARGHGIHTYKDYDDMLADPELDIVLIALPNHLHKDHAIRAMRAGKHVLCEKPVMMNSDELIEVMQVAKETGKVFYPRQNRRWDKDYLIIKNAYDNKLVGEPFNVECRIMGSRGIPGDWRGVKEYGGGMMLDWGVHILDRLLMMIPEKIKYVFCANYYITNKECEDNLKIHLTFESGMTAVMEVATCHFVNLPLWYLAGDQGTAVINSWDCDGKIMRLKSWEDRDAKPIMAGEGLTKTMAPRTNNSVEEYPLPEVETDSCALYLNLVDTINGEAEQLVTAEQALRVLRLMEACFKSAETHTVVDFE